MVQKVFNFPESTSATQTHTVNIPGLASLTSVTVNTGTVTASIDGDNITLTLKGGTYSRRVQTGGTYTPSDTKYVSEERYQYYDRDGYVGTLNFQYESMSPFEACVENGGGSRCNNLSKTGTKYYHGNVTKPAVDTRTYQNYYKYSVTMNYIDNSAPTISGQDTNLGDKNLGFIVTYQVNDVDITDNLVVTERLNGSVIRTINGAPRNENLEIEITNKELFSLPLNSDNTIEIKVDDQNGGIAYRRYTFRRTNTAPIISDNDKDLGQKTEPFAVDFSASDNEGNSITVKTYLDNMLKEEYQAEDGATNTFTISKEDWFKLPIGNHSIKIEAIDEHGATAVRNYTFTRFDDKIQISLKAPIETDIMATKILVTPTWTIPAGAIAKIEACNNGFDEVPTWEDITSQVNISRHYNFTNTNKIADKWGINIRFTIEKGTATEQCIVNGFGGAFE